jgi:hypothetical protein
MSLSTGNQPECYGQLWDPKAAECSGGYDPVYVGPNGSKVRPKCDFFESCKVRLMLRANNERQANLVPTAALIRSSTQAVPYQQPQPIIPGRQAIQPQHLQSQQQQQYSYPPMQFAPIQMMPVNYTMPAYLSTPEHQREGESYWAPMFREIGRGMGKAMGHAIAHFFDHVPLTRKDKE